MKSMTAPLNRKMYFLTDPIEDRAKDWLDYKINYQATFAAQLMYPAVAPDKYGPAKASLRMCLPPDTSVGRQK